MTDEEMAKALQNSISLRLSAAEKRVAELEAEKAGAEALLCDAQAEIAELKEALQPAMPVIKRDK